MIDEGEQKRVGETSQYKGIGSFINNNKSFYVTFFLTRAKTSALSAFFLSPFFLSPEGDTSFLSGLLDFWCSLSDSDDDSKKDLAICSKHDE